ncbi:Zinc finger BED domain-containing protein RICESLEEPER 2 [Heracleum sosnowskyi]|uniref:Zinc finger BED domain-containing protein RICESLEEPER 2 n=1 Tax=Heracleum sosnowskyi TaxID=360622 RepID=A0AAD8MXT4_9APIA|nr:Zinc finger BED domain-containing protein RICESLEEPER 2 [Heracleum sosnowskyi]
MCSQTENLNQQIHQPSSINLPSQPNPPQPLGQTSENVNNPNQSNPNEQIPQNTNTTPADQNDKVILGKRKGKTSPVWEHFNIKKFNGKEKAICKYCNKELGGDSKNGTKHLHDHLKRCQKRKQMDIRQHVLVAENKKNDGSVTIKSYYFDQETSRKEMANMIIMYDYPINMVNHYGFRRYSLSLQQQYRIVSPNTTRNDILKIYESEKKKMMKVLEKNKSRVGVTSDMWTSSNKKRGYMVITGHYIDDSWKLKSCILRFAYVPCPHTAEALCGVIMDVIEEATERIRDSVVYWTATPKREEKFEEAARQLHINFGKKLELDCVTRWNSTYNMLETAIAYKDVFPRLRQREHRYKCVPTEDDWVIGKEICEKLKIFSNVIELFSGTKYPTANIYFPKVCLIKMKITEWLCSQNVVIQSMASKMLPKFENFWNEIHGIMGVTAVLDPRYKMQLLEYYFPLLYGREARIKVDTVRQICYDLVSEYQSKTSENGDVSESVATVSPFVSSTSHSVDPVEASLFGFDLFVKKNQNSIASESAFSTSGRILSAHRSRLQPETLEALMCTRDWLWASISGNPPSAIIASEQQDDSVIEVIEVVCMDGIEEIDVHSDLRKLSTKEIASYSGSSTHEAA